MRSAERHDCIIIGKRDGWSASTAKSLLLTRLFCVLRIHMDYLSCRCAISATGSTLEDPQTIQGPLCSHTFFALFISSVSPEIHPNIQCLNIIFPPGLTPAFKYPPQSDPLCQMFTPDHYSVFIEVESILP